MTPNTHPPDAAADDTAVKWRSRLESEAASLRADNAALREQLTLRDQALDATPTFFVIARQAAPEPIIVYCNPPASPTKSIPRYNMWATARIFCAAPTRISINCSM